MTAAAKRATRPKASRQNTSAEEARQGWQALRGRLAGIVDALRHAGVSPIDGLEQVAELIYLKLLDEKEPLKGSAIFPERMAGRFRWSQFSMLPGVELQQVLGDHVLSYMGSLVTEALAIADYYRDATLKIEDPKALERIVGLIDGIDFKKLRPDEMGRILEYLLENARPSGEFRTPHHLRALMVTLVDPAEGERIYDPACGTAGFLTDAITYLLAKYSSAPREVSIYGEDGPAGTAAHPFQPWREEGGKPGLDRVGLGQLIHGHDISRRMVRIARMNLELQGIGIVNVRRASSLSTFGGISPEEMAQKYDVILCAPTFGDAPLRDELRPDLPIPSTRTELLFLEVAMQSLAPGGRSAIVVPDSVLFNQGSTFVEVRRWLLSRFEVLAVISLPLALFRSYSGVKTSIVVFRRPASPGRQIETQHVWFYEVQHDGYDWDRNPQPEQNDIPDLLMCWERFKASDYLVPPGLKAAGVVDPMGALRCWWAPQSLIEENLLDLTAKRYKPRPIEISLVSPEVQLAKLAEVRDAFAQSVEALMESTDENALPRGWREGARHEKLGDLVEVITGKTPATDNASYWGGSIPWVSPKDMKRYVIDGAKDHVTERAIAENQLNVVEPFAVLVVVRSMILSHSIPVAVSSVPLAVNQDVYALEPPRSRGDDGRGKGPASVSPDEVRCAPRSPV